MTIRKHAIRFLVLALPLDQSAGRAIEDRGAQIALRRVDRKVDTDILKNDPRHRAVSSNKQCVCGSG